MNENKFYIVILSSHIASMFLIRRVSSWTIKRNCKDVFLLNWGFLSLRGLINKYRVKFTKITVSPPQKSPNTVISYAPPLNNILGKTQQPAYPGYNEWISHMLMRLFTKHVRVFEILKILGFHNIFAAPKFMVIS